MPDTVELRTMDEALKWGDSWREAYNALLRQHENALRELGMQRTFADVFAEQWNRLYWDI